MATVWSTARINFKHMHKYDFDYHLDTPGCLWNKIQNSWSEHSKQKAKKKMYELKEILYM